MASIKHKEWNPAATHTNYNYPIIGILDCTILTQKHLPLEYKYMYVSIIDTVELKTVLGFITTVICQLYNSKCSYIIIYP